VYDSAHCDIICFDPVTNMIDFVLDIDGINGFGLGGGLTGYRRWRD
jgi:hypothetical protein